ncbi:MAG: hypothetical protein QOJ96_3336 [Alphaproteobacteria bacterium]|jgi:hypothetical protein|nr:hypothetical protein [Alphaproteobacteria bacterium]
MRRLLWIAAGAALVVSAAVADRAQAQSDDGNTLRIEWEVKNRFRLFRNEADFQRHVAANRGDGILAAEDRLESTSDGRGWAKDMVDHLCVDGAGKLTEFCERDGEREVYLAPADHRVGATLAGAVPAGATCVWNFDDGSIPPQQASVNCNEEVRLRLRYGKPTIASVGVTAPDGSIQQATTEIQVHDFLIAGLGDSIASGEGNPDRAVALSDTGFCFRRFLGSSSSEYFRPGRAGYRGDKTCGATVTGSGTGGSGGADEWQRHSARWSSAPCHRSLYSYQMRAALALAVESPHLAVTYIPLACSGATIEAGLLGPQRSRECTPATRTASCAATVPGQLAQLQEFLTLAHRHQADRGLDLMLLTAGANDIHFSGLVANVIIEEGTERLLFSQGGLLANAEDAGKILDTQLPAGFAKLRTALKPLVGGNLSRVVYVSYGHPALLAEDTPCPGGRDGFDVHPAFSAESTRLRRVADFVSVKFLPKIKALATCEAGTICRDPASEKMTFVDAHQAEFAHHGFCARADSDPVFDRECFSAAGESFESSLVEAANGPLACSLKPSDFRPYAPRARWVRTANDSYFTAMTYPEGVPTVLQPADIHDATWGALSAVYGGAIHPTAEGHAAMAEAALPAVRKILGLPQAAVTAAPLPLPEAPAEN